MPRDGFAYSASGGRIIARQCFCEICTMSQHEEVAVAAPEVRKSKRPKHDPPKPQPRYHVVLWNDDDHSFEYVIDMLRQLFGHPETAGMKIAESVHVEGRAICLTTTMEHAELKRDQIHAFGREKGHPRCKGSMKASIEPER
jgi:ATP-dependent Clp protease adaptor protein ClpS